MLSRMTNPQFDEEDEKPLDPAVAQVERRVRRLMLIAGLTLGLGIFAVLAAILYRIATLDATSPVGPAADTVSAAEAEQAVRSALAAWNADFNAGNSETICDLFAPDLRYDFPGFPERGYDEICALLQGSLADRTRTFSYALDIREVIVSGDLAVVRLVWTLTVRPAGGGDAISSREPGMDIFRWQADSTWKIVRYIAYEE
jgi:steroid delta-isomerase